MKNKKHKQKSKKKITGYGFGIVVHAILFYLELFLDNNKKILRKSDIRSVFNMSEIVLKNAVIREKGYLYFIDKIGNICRAKMGAKKSKKKS